MTKWRDLWDAIQAMQPGDPPLRWTVGKKQQRNLSIMTNNWARRFGLKVRTFYHCGEMWIVRLPGSMSAINQERNA